MAETAFEIRSADQSWRCPSIEIVRYQSDDECFLDPCNFHDLP